MKANAIKRWQQNANKSFFSTKNTGKLCKKKKKKNANRIDLFCSKEKATDNRVCTLSSFGGISSNDNDASIYSRSCRRLERNNRWSSTVWSTYSAKRLMKTFGVSRETFGFMTGLGVSTVCTICKEVTRAIVENMWVDSVSKHMPKSEDFKKNILEREEI